MGASDQSSLVKSAPGPRVAILGAGAGGICMGIRLKKAGFGNFTIYEKASDIGGTWRDNTYPGSGCDVPSHLYCYSFAPKKDWTRAFAEQWEILDYFRHCTKRFGLEPHLRFGVEIARADFDEAAGVWRLATTKGETLEADIVVSGLGQLNRPYTPKLEGAGIFAGHSFHSARWDHAYDLAGKRVAVIGSGASAIQFVPQIAPKVGRLTLFQRTPNWVIPKPDRVYPAWERWLLKYVPGLHSFYRNWTYFMLEFRFLAFRQKHPKLRAFYEKGTLKDMASHIEDPALFEKIKPDYPMGCKRILISNDYLQSLNRPNVSVVTEKITRLVPQGVETAGGTVHEADLIIYATGFHTTEFLSPVRITGRTGVTLDEEWKNGAEAYYGVAVSGFPNFFMLYGPNTNLGHNSIIFMMEQQTSYILKCVKEIARKNIKFLDVKRDVMRAFNDELQNELAGSVWAANCPSWYKNAAGKVTNNWSTFTITYWRRMLAPDFSAYEAVPRPA